MSWCIEQQWPVPCMRWLLYLRISRHRRLACVLCNHITTWYALTRVSVGVARAKIWKLLSLLSLPRLYLVMKAAAISTHAASKKQNRKRMRQKYYLANEEMGCGGLIWVYVGPLKSCGELWQNETSRVKSNKHLYRRVYRPEREA